MKKIIMLFNTTEEYSAFYKKYHTEKGINVAVVAGLELALSINIADVGNYDLDFYSNEECEKQHQDSLLQKRIHARIYERRGQSPVTHVIEVAPGETRTFMCNEKGDPIEVHVAGLPEFVWIKDERYEAKPTIVCGRLWSETIKKEWVLSRNGRGEAYLLLSAQEDKFWLIPFGGDLPYTLESTQVAFINTQIE